MLRHALVAFSFLFSSCLKTASTSQTHHKAGELTNGPEPWQWYSPSDREVPSYLASLGFPMDTLLPDEHLAVRRARYWLGEIMKVLEARDAALPPERKRLRGVPPPRLFVTRDRVENAWVHGGLLCIPLRFRWPDPGNAPMRQEVLSFDFLNKTLQLKRDERCFSPSQPIDPGEFARWFNAKSNPCKLQADGGEVWLGEGCLTPEFRETARRRGASGARMMTMMTTFPIIVFGAGFIAAAEGDAQVVSVIAHELGHILKSHYTNDDRPEYNYFFQHDAVNGDKRPDPSPALQEKGQRLLALSRDISYFHVSEERFDPSLFSLSVGFARREAFSFCGENQVCRSQCGALSEFAKAPSFSRIADAGGFPGLGRAPAFPFAPMADADKPTYLRFQALLAACAANEPLVESEPPREQVVHALTDEMPEAFVQRVTQSLASARQRLEYWDAISAGWRERERYKAELYSESVALGLGYYTAEQEADDLSAELTSALGFSPREMIDFEYIFGEIKERRDGIDPFSMPLAQCRTAEKNGWRDGSGRAVVVPLGSLADTHHGACYRIFNISREMVAHGYPATSSREVARELPAPWSEVRASVSGAPVVVIPPAALRARGLLP